jgi:hypothetical protein
MFPPVDEYVTCSSDSHLVVNDDFMTPAYWEKKRAVFEAYGDGPWAHDTDYGYENETEMVWRRASLPPGMRATFVVKGPMILVPLYYEGRFQLMMHIGDFRVEDDRELGRHLGCHVHIDYYRSVVELDIADSADDCLHVHVRTKAGEDLGTGIIPVDDLLRERMPPV